MPHPNLETFVSWMIHDEEEQSLFACEAQSWLMKETRENPFWQTLLKLVCDEELLVSSIKSFLNYLKGKGETFDYQQTCATKAILCLPEDTTVNVRRTMGEIWKHLREINPSIERQA